MSAPPGGMPALRVALIDNYDSYTYNLFQLIWELSGQAPVVLQNDQVSVDTLLAAGYTHFVISPGPGHPGQTRDFGVCGELIARTQVPCLGVCLGHQGIANAFGARIAAAPTIMHGRLSAVHHDGSGIFRGIPQGFQVVRYHSLAVTTPLPAEMRLTAWSDDGVVMGLAHRSRPLWGVQFHPESVETTHGPALIGNFLGLSPAARPRLELNQSQSPEPATRPDVRWREVESPAEIGDIYAELFAGQPHSFWLDSAQPGYGTGRFSFIGAPDSATPRVLRAFAGGRCVEETDAGGTRTYPGSIFDLLRDRLPDPTLCDDSPVPFVGGFVGYLGYGIRGQLGGGPPAHSSTPDAELMWVDRLVARDHQTGQTYLVASGPGSSSADEWFERTRARIAHITSRAEQDVPVPAAQGLHPGVDYSTYCRHFNEIQRWLAEGNSYEACYTYQIAATSEADPLDVYRRLRHLNPSPYAAYLSFGSRKVLSSSPERLLRVTGDRWAETRPIKGTAARLEDPDADQLAAQGLSAEEKTRSESLMIVDLLRNDLGRMCAAGTISVPTLMAVESYPQVHQLVTTIRGRLRPGVSASDCLSALLPAGSMTGSPKRRTVELLDSLELQDRGIYSGCLGYFSVNGQSDHSVVIRTIVWDRDTVSIGVGGAITALSDVRSEYEETLLKARAPLAALGVALARQPEPGQLRR